MKYEVGALLIGYMVRTDNGYERDHAHVRDAIERPRKREHEAYDRSDGRPQNRAGSTGGNCVEGQQTVPRKNTADIREYRTNHESVKR